MFPGGYFLFEVGKTWLQLLKLGIGYISYQFLYEYQVCLACLIFRQQYRYFYAKA